MVVRHQQTEKRVHTFRQNLGCLVTVYDNYKRTAGCLPEQYGIDRFGGAGQAREADGAFFTGELVDGAREAGVPAQFQEQISNRGMGQDYCPETNFTIFVVE
jgi:hypothetical protein